MLLNLVLSPRAEPNRARYVLPRSGDAGFDIICCADYNLSPMSVTRLETGLTLEFHKDLVAIIHDRSSMAMRGLHVFGGVIDSSYRGEISVVMFNAMPSVQYIPFGSKIAQIVFTQHSVPTTIKFYNDLDALTQTERGANGFGSTDKLLQTAEYAPHKG